MQTKTLLVILLAVYGFSSAALAARVENLYAAEVPLGSGSEALQGAFDTAMAQVLVKVTGRPDIVANAGVAAGFRDAARFVQQYRIDADDLVWIRFDEVAVRRTLDGLDAPVWGVERPTTLVWLVLDEGFGQRRMLGGVPEDEMTAGPPPQGDEDGSPARRINEELHTAAKLRGLPLLMPLVDAQDMLLISLSDVWGGFNDSLRGASQRYRPDAILVGRARAGALGPVGVRWTLLVDDERFDWEGDVASGPDDVADFFATRYAASSGTSRTIALTIDNVNSLDAYGRLSVYLAGLDLVEVFSVDRVRDDRVVFRLEVRGDADLLMRSIALQRVLQPIDEPLQAPIVDPRGAQGLHYRLMAGP